MAETGLEQLRLYNTMTGRKEVFRPVVPGKVGIYVGGFAPCGFCPIGQARTYVCVDLLYRFLKRLGYEVTYVRTHNDIDDKVFKKAKLCGRFFKDISMRYSYEFARDMFGMGCLRPTSEPFVSTHIPQIIEMIQKIIHNGYGYTIGGEVYFSVDSFPEYGCLSGKKLNDGGAGRGETSPINSQKKNLADFILWKPFEGGEMWWDSPWGPGRPGRHIGCSVIGAHYMGLHCDIHGGGQDLIFPDHDNEIAVRKAVLPESTVNCWMHNGIVNLESEKMTESLNDFATIWDLKTEQHHPLAIRYFLINAHYRSEINCNDNLLEMASDRVYYIYQTLASLEEALEPIREGILSDGIPSDIMALIEKLQFGFQAKMLDDLQTSSVLDGLMEPLKAINKHLKLMDMPVLHGLVALEKVVKDTLGCLGLFTSSCSSLEILEQLKDKALKRAGLTEEQVMEMIQERSWAIQNRDFEKALKISEELYARGISIVNGPNGTVWRPREPPEIQFDFGLDITCQILNSDSMDV